MEPNISFRLKIVFHSTMGNGNFVDFCILHSHGENVAYHSAPSLHCLN